MTNLNRILLLVFAVYQTQAMTLMDYVNSRHKRQTGSGRLGDSCRQNTDCVNYLMFCSSGTCACSSGAVQYNNVCYQKIEPGRQGCQYDVQCSAVWPMAKCLSSMCTCPTNYFPATTKDGNVCVLQGGGNCPLPDGTGAVAVNALMKLSNTGSGLATCVTTSGCGKATGATLTVNTNADIYDCIPNSQSDVNGVCCPSRSLTCSQAVGTGGTGSGLATATRYFYNSVSDSCQQFTFNPNGADVTNTNTNNFATMDHCTSYCQNSCARKAAQYTSSLYEQSSTVLFCSASSNNCDNNHDCNRIGSQYQCCSKTKSVCSLSGAREIAYGAVVPTVPDVGFQGYSVAITLTRWYFNPATGLCSSFLYLGSGGNLNNFGTQTDCLNYCQQEICTYGQPLKTTSGDNQACSSDSDCPTSYSCSTGNGLSIQICCPRTQTICAQSLMIGYCSNQWSTRYWHNPTTGECQSFQYSGCGGNDNNFRTQFDCQNACTGTTGEPQCVQGIAYRDSYGKYYTCSVSGGTGQGVQACPVNYECKFDGFIYGCCPTQGYTCSLTYDSGRVCGTATSRWYFDTSNQRCTTMTYYGCDGNPNNFPSKQTCETYCGVGGCPNGGQYFLEASNSYPRICSSAVTCPAGYECASINDAGSIASRCCPTKANICETPPIVGQACGSSSTERYYYNRLSKACTKFQFMGCDTNGNNFGTLAQCNNFCGSAACSGGDVAFTDPNTQKPLQCNPALTNSCPTGYSCKYDTLNKVSVCCGGNNMGVCSQNEKAYVDALTMNPKQCLPSNPASCPSPFLCKLNTMKGKYYCSFCPADRAVRYDVVSRQPVSCTINLFANTCPTGYTCQTSLAGAFTGFCCSAQSVCQGNVPFDKDVAGNPVTCSLGFVQGCRTGFSCQISPGSQNGYCCQGGNNDLTVQAGCPGSLVAQTSNGQVVTCNAFQGGSGCGNGFTCQWASENNRYQCCGNAPVNLGSCPSGYNPALTNGRPQSCTVTNPNCPTGSICLTGTAGQALCCSLGNNNQGITCNSDQVSFNGQCLSKVSVGQQCVVTEQCLGQSLCLNGACNCPVGFQFLNGICQPPNSVTVRCANNAQSYPPGSTTPQTCTPNSVNACPSGYICSSSTQSGQFICCQGSTPQLTAVCPTGSTAQLNNGQPINCGNGNTFSCTGSNTCTYSPANRGYYCCGNAPQPQPGSQGCPSGSPLLYTFASPPSPLQCNLNSNQCGPGYSCFNNQVVNYPTCCPTNTVSFSVRGWSTRQAAKTLMKK